MAHVISYVLSNIHNKYFHGILIIRTTHWIKRADCSIFMLPVIGEKTRLGDIVYDSYESTDLMHFIAGITILS